MDYDKIRLGSISELADCRYVKAGYTNNYGLISFYNAKQESIMTIQIMGGEPETAMLRWLNYLGLVVASDKQKEADKVLKETSSKTQVDIKTEEEVEEDWNGEKENESEIYLDITWVSQFNGSYFGNETCWSKECCNKAAKKIVLEAGATPADRIIIAQTNRSCENEKGTRTEYDDSGLTFNKKEFNEAVQVINTSLKEHKLPVMIGVQHPYWNNQNKKWYYKCGSKSNNPRATNHFIVIVGKGYDKTKKMEFYYFYEVGTSDKTTGTSKTNKLWVDTKQYIIKGNVSNKIKQDYYIVTDVRKNAGKTYNLKK